MMIIGSMGIRNRAYPQTRDKTENIPTNEKSLIIKLKFFFKKACIMNRNTPKVRNNIVMISRYITKGM